MTKRRRKKHKPFRDRQFAQRQWTIVMVLHTKSLLVRAGDDSYSRRHALRSRDMATRKSQTVPSQLINMCRPNVPVDALKT